MMMVGLGVTLSTLVIQGAASALGAEAITALLMRRVQRLKAIVTRRGAGHGETQR